MDILELPKTVKVAKSVNSKYYFTGKLCKNGHVAKRFTSTRACVKCKLKWDRDNKERINLKSREKYKNNPEIGIANSAKHRKNNPEKSFEYYKNNREKELVRCANYRRNNPKKNALRNANYQKNNPEICRAKSARYRKNNPEKSFEYRKNNSGLCASLVAKRRAAKLNRTPSWLTNDDKRIIKDIYTISSRVSKQTGIKHHVDHVIPLQGELVSGLHVPSNLQLLTAKANLAKGNKLLQEFI